MTGLRVVLGSILGPCRGFTAVSFGVAGSKPAPLAVSKGDKDRALFKGYRYRYVEVHVDIGVYFGCFQRGLKVSLGILGGLEAVMVLTLICLK